MKTKLVEKVKTVTMVKLSLTHLLYKIMNNSDSSFKSTNVNLSNKCKLNYPKVLLSGPITHLSLNSNVVIELIS